MPILSAPDLLFVPEDPPFVVPQEVLVPGRTPEPAQPSAAAPEPGSVLAEAATPDVAPMEAPLVEPAFALAAEDAFPTRAELDAILAANAGPPAGPDAAEREAAAALLGLDPGVAADPALYDATLPRLPEPNANEALAAWLAEAGVPPPDGPEPAGDWMFG